MLMQIRASRAKQFRGFWRDLLYVLLIVVIAVVGSVPFLFLKNVGTAIDFICYAAAIFLAIAVVSPIWLIKLCIIFWPFIFYWLGCVRKVRQQEFLSIIQASIETQTPLGKLVRAYAATKYGAYRTKLSRFADAIDHGLTLQQALAENQGLLRYDVQGMLTVGTDDKEVLKALEQIESHHVSHGVFISNTMTRLIYLGVIFLQMLNVSLFLMLWIVPEFKKIFDEFGIALPVMTLILIKVCDFFTDFWFLAVPFLLVAGLILILYLIMQTGYVSARPVVIRRMFRAVDAARFLRILGMGLKCDTPLPKILAVYSKLVDSEYLRKKGNRINRNIQSGKPWLEQLRREKIVSRGEERLLETAERTGNLGHMVGELANSKEQRQMVGNDLTSKLVFIPLMLIAGFLVGFLVIAMFLPIVQLITALS